MVLALLDAYGGFHQLALAYERERGIDQHNARLLKHLAYQTPPTPQDIEKRKAAARARIRETRAPFFALQEAGERELETKSAQIRAAQESATFKGLADTVSALSQVVWRITEGVRSEQGLKQDGLTLYFHRENLRNFVERLDGTASLSQQLKARSLEALDVLDALGDDPRALEVPVVQQVAAHLRSFMETAVARERGRHAPGQHASPLARALEVDPLTGQLRRPKDAPPQAPSATSPSTKTA